MFAEYSASRFSTEWSSYVHKRVSAIALKSVSDVRILKNSCKMECCCVLYCIGRGMVRLLHRDRLNSCMATPQICRNRVFYTRSIHQPREKHKQWTLDLPVWQSKLSQGNYCREWFTDWHNTSTCRDASGVSVFSRELIWIQINASLWTWKSVSHQIPSRGSALCTRRLLIPCQGLRLRGARRPASHSRIILASICPRQIEYDKYFCNLCSEWWVAHLCQIASGDKLWQVAGREGAMEIKQQRPRQN